MIHPDHSAISRSLIDAYRNTLYRVPHLQEPLLRVGFENVALREMYETMKCAQSAVITAWNPYSAKTSDKDNAAAQDRLLAKIRASGHDAWEAFGEDPSGKWPGEPSFFVPGIGLTEATSLGVEFGQNAIIWTGADAVPQLILLR